jgi:hypothetical protein
MHIWTRKNGWDLRELQAVQSIVMCRAGLGSKARAWAGLWWAWACQNAEPGPLSGLGLGLGWLGTRPRLVYRDYGFVLSDLILAQPHTPSPPHCPIKLLYYQNLLRICSFDCSRDCCALCFNFKSIIALTNKKPWRKLLICAVKDSKYLMYVKIAHPRIG